jgi:ubiquitin C-terminal hydrolase
MTTTAFSWKLPGDVGLPNLSGQQCFMSVVFQMLYCQQPLRTHIREFLRHAKRIEWFHAVTEEERLILQVFWYLMGYRKLFLSLENMTMLYRLGWKNETAIQEQDAREFLHSLVDHLTESKTPSILRSMIVPRYGSTTEFLCFLWILPPGEESSKPKGWTGEEVLRQARLPFLEPKYPQDPPYRIEETKLEKERYFWMEVHSTEPIRWGEVNEFEMGGRTCHCRAAALQSNHHYQGLVSEEEDEWSVVDDARVWKVQGGWSAVSPWIGKYACLYLFEWEKLKIK